MNKNSLRLPRKPQSISMNKWQLTGVILKDPEYHPDPTTPEIEVMIFTLKNVERDPDGRKRAVFVLCSWTNPNVLTRRLFRSRTLVQVEGYGYLGKTVVEGRPSFTMAMTVSEGQYIREMAELSVIG